MDTVGSSLLRELELVKVYRRPSCACDPFCYWCVCPTEWLMLRIELAPRGDENSCKEGCICQAGTGCAYLLLSAVALPFWWAATCAHTMSCLECRECKCAKALSLSSLLGGEERPLTSQPAPLGSEGPPPPYA